MQNLIFQITKRLDTIKSFETQLYTINDQSFDEIALRLFRFQALNNPVYRDYVENLHISVDTIDQVSRIPFLPISFFKSYLLKTGEWTPVMEFASSGTTGATTSRHIVKDLDRYNELCLKTFEAFFGSTTDYHFLALLPSYLERSNSSLILMLDHFMKESKSPFSRFYSSDYKKLLYDLDTIKDDRKVIVWGVSFALLELAEQFHPDLKDCMVFETGGMKGRRKEITRHELHQVLSEKLNVDVIYSEYGMTELLSQAYTKGGSRFFCSDTMKVLAREVTDPFNVGVADAGGLNVIDLANIHSIAFIETEDIGKVYADGSFEVLGRMDNSDIRGCNLLMR